MDFIWVSDIPTTNTHTNKLPHPTTTNTTNPTTQTNAVRNIPLLHSNSEQQLRTVGSRLSYPASSTSTNSLTLNNHTRHQRSRADTMPSSTSPFLGGGLSTSLYNHNKNLTAQGQQRPNLHLHNRSESLTTTLGTNYDPTASSSGMSSPLDENASSSIASTLASLGLHDDQDSNKEQVEEGQHYFTKEPLLTRNRSFTVSNQNNDNGDMMSFRPFERRPRAISLGMADSPFSQQQQQIGFSPFDNGSMYSSGSGSQHSNSNNLAAADMLYQSRSSSSSLFARMDSHEEEEQGFIDYHDDPEDDTLSACQTPSRALWLGNVSPSLSVPDLHKLFNRYGRVESARILSDKECAFINFESVESALAAKEDLVSRLGSKVAGAAVKVGFGKANVDVAMALTVDQGPNAHGPTRSLWVGNIPASINPAALRSLFQSFGPIESIRILSQKNCGFVNFEKQEDSVRARKMLQNKEILGPGTGTVRIGFAKTPINNPDEVIQDVVISGDDTVTSYPLPAPPTSVPAAAAATAAAAAASRTSPPSPVPANSQQQQLQEQQANEAPNSNNTTQWATILLMASMMMNESTKAAQQSGSQPTRPNLPNTPSPSTSSTTSQQINRLAAERKLIMQHLGYDKIDEVEQRRIPITYFSVIPPVPEFSSNRMLSPLRLREIRKALENGTAIPDIELVAKECMQEIVELCSDYIGNTVVQKLFEFCSQQTKLAMLIKIAPCLASIGIHKNGTWAAQKIIDTANTDQQIQLICSYMAPFVPLLLLDQFGNYVVQCCLRMGPTRNQYIFDAIVDKCWEIGQGRFGARAVRAIVENAVVTKDQQIYVAAAIMQNALLLTTNANGSILLNWLLDSSKLLGHFRTLCNNNTNN